MPRVAWIVRLRSQLLTAAVTAAREQLTAGGLLDAGEVRTAADLRTADVVLVWADQPLPDDLVSALVDPSVRVLLAGPTITDADGGGLLAEAAGLAWGAWTPVHDLRLRVGADAVDALRPAGHSHGDQAHSDQHEHLTDRVVTVDKVLDDVAVLRVARVGLHDQPVLTWRAATGTGAWTMGTQAGSVAHPTSLRALSQVLRWIGGQQAPAPERVGLLGYGAIGHEHSRAVRATDGLTLTAACDTSSQRLEQAAEAAPGIATNTSAEALLERDDVDLVVISTPPDSHAQWALRAIAAGKHVVVEKPFAIHTRDADEVIAAATAADRLAVVYQNRRYDPDFLALRRRVDAGDLGGLFHVELFVGGYGHPCNLWHSDESVSGGAFYDWGSHLLDQALNLMPQQIEYVTAATHKLCWFDVTNADHSRVTVRFVDGAEAEFVHSDLAAALKPRWYVLGTTGAVVGNWRTERVISRTDIGTLAEDVLAPADSPPTMDLYAADGSRTRLATPAGQPYGFHRELVDRLQWGIPMSVTAQQSRRVVAVMEAAAESAADQGRPVVPR